MRRDQLEHLLCAASTITDDPNVIVFGSQAILGSFAEQLLPPEAIYSVEAGSAPALVDSGVWCFELMPLCERH